MSDYLYDESMLAKIKSWTDRADVRVYNVNGGNEFFETIADNTSDATIKLPLITFRRGGYTILNVNKKPLTYCGLTVTADDGSIQILNAIPINLAYQFDIYARKYKEASMLARDLIFNIINNPTLEVTIPYNEVNYKHYANLRLSDSVEDSSGIPERLEFAQFTRFTLNVYIDDAYLWSAPIKNEIIIGDGLYVQAITPGQTTVTEQITF